ncbi:helix-turn-helix domain-containing protein [Patescibacteria group bacterium]
MKNINTKYLDIKKRGHYTKTQKSIVDLFLSSSDKVVPRDQIAEAMWNGQWLEKYSDWAIDRHIYLLNKKAVNFQIKAVRGRGYYLTMKNQTSVPKINPQKLAVKKVPGTSPTASYLKYMNDPSEDRKVMRDLFESVENENLTKHFSPVFAQNPGLKFLAINSYSVDNIDSVVDWLKVSKVKRSDVYFTNFDELALNIHQKHTLKSKFENVHVIYDDIRDTRLQENNFDIIINDFRLNFNTDHKQNTVSIKNMKSLLKNNGLVLISVVVDSRYESDRFGQNQEKAPINKTSPWMFEGDEGLERFCFTVPYYKKLFTENGFEIVSEFDVVGGKKWKVTGKEDKGISYRRYVLKPKNNN